MKRILKPIFLSIDLLSPLTLLRVSKNPATIVFGFDNEDSERRDDHVIDLGGSGFGGMWKIEIVKELVLCGIEFAQAAVDHFFSKPAFEDG